MRLGRLVSLSYLLGSLLILLPLLDLAANVWPWAPGVVNWRYGAYGLLSGFILTPFMGLVLLLGTGVAAGHARFVRVVAVVSWVLAVVLLGVTVIYGLDALQVRASVPGEARSQFGIGTVKALIKNVILFVALLWTGRVGWRVSRRESGRR